MRLGELASRSWLRRRRSLWGELEQVGERGEARTTHQFVEQAKTAHAAAESQTVDTDPRSNQGEGALLDFVEARKVVGSCTSPDQWAITKLAKLLSRWRAPVIQDGAEFCIRSILHMQILAPFCFACGRHLERGFSAAKLLAAHTQSQCLLMALRPYQYVEEDNFLHLRRRLTVSQFSSGALCV